VILLRLAWPRGVPAPSVGRAAVLRGADTDDSLREAADVITGASAPWRMPDTTSACPNPAG
jgi:hypothetical protein